MLTCKNFVPPTMLLYSVNESGQRLACFRLRYPKMVHGDFMTHRALSRNASSSRAIPTARLSGATETDLYTPEFRLNKSGMQPGDYLPDNDMLQARAIWREAADHCLAAARVLASANGLNVHKQWANRMIEWFGYINVIVSATDFDNFIGLREELDENANPMAQDEIYFQAIGIRDLLASREPKLLRAGEWHMPLILPEEAAAMATSDLLRISAARCAGISYETVNGEPMTIERANKVCNKLLTARRVHASPFEHQARADPLNRQPELHGNFQGWIQHRKLIPNECIRRTP